jgi:acetyl esterase/lipase
MDTSMNTIPLLEREASGPDTEILEDNRVYKVQHPCLLAFPSGPGESPRPAVVICPGGGYNCLSIDKEGYQVARWFNALGVHAWILKYRLKEFGYPAPLRDVTRAIRHLRAHADSLGIRPEAIGVLGFSAGGHVAAMASTLFDSPDARTGDPLDQVSARPDFSVLAYPVITLHDPFAHQGSRTNLLGENPDPERLHRLSLENAVSNATPPTFLMHSAEDPAVPVENALQYARALSRHKVPFSLHVYPAGPHGTGMLPGFGTLSSWPTALAAWLEETVSGGNPGT